MSALVVIILPFPSLCFRTCTKAPLFIITLFKMGHIARTIDEINSKMYNIDYKIIARLFIVNVTGFKYLLYPTEYRNSGLCNSLSLYKVY